MRPPGTHLYGWLRRWMEPKDAEQVAWPLLADVQAEWSQARAAGRGGRAFAIRCAGYGQLLRAVLAVGTARRWRAALGVQPALLGPLLLLGLAGIWLALRGPLGGSRGPAQLAYLALGLTGALVAATTSKRQLRLLAPVAAVVSLLVLAAVPLYAVSHANVGRWLRWGGLAVHAALLVMPLVLLGLAWLANRRAWFGAYLLAVLGLLAAQPNLPVTGIVALGAVAVAWWSPSRGLALLLSTGGLAAALVRAPEAHTTAHLEILAGQMSARGVLLGGLLVLAAAWLTGSLRSLWRDWLTRDHRGAFAARLGLGCILGIPLQLAWLTMADGSVPLLSYGGTAPVALLVTFGLALAARQDRGPATA